MQKTNRTDEPVIFSKSALAFISTHILQLAQKNKARGLNTTICIAGGSCTGKTSQVAKGLDALLSPHAQVVSQDNYQLGLDLPADIDRIYRWDSPLNYGVSESAFMLEKLKSGEKAVIPEFSFREKRRTGIQEINPSEIVLFEGLYAFKGGISKIADLTIYVEAPLFARLLRRIFRNSYERYTNEPTLVLNRILQGGVFKAHEDLVTKQRKVADIILQMPFDFEESIWMYPITAKNLDEDTYDIIFSFQIDQRSLIRILKVKDGAFYFCVIFKEQLLFRAVLEEEAFNNFMQLNLRGY